MTATITAAPRALHPSLLGAGILATVVASVATPVVAAAGTRRRDQPRRRRRADPGARVRQADRRSSR